MTQEIAPKRVSELPKSSQEPHVKAAQYYEKFFNVEIEGLENLEELDDDENVIFVPSHILDMDVPIALSQIGKYREHIKVGNESSHYSLENPPAFFATKLAGMEYFRPVHHAGTHRNRMGDISTWLNSESYQTLLDDLKHGDDVMISAYFDTNYANKTAELSDRIGVGAILLAAASGKRIVPVAVDFDMERAVGLGDMNVVDYLKNLKTKEGIGKPRVKMSICKPITIGEIDDVESLPDLIKRKKGPQVRTGLYPGQKLAIQGRREKVRKIHNDLLNQSRIVMNSIADMLPSKKRGMWGSNK